MNLLRTLVGTVLLFGGFAACAHGDYLEGTTVPDTPTNRDVLSVVEKYRERLVSRDVEGLLVLASKNYFEDGGTPRADDDYGYAGLHEVLSKRLSRIKTIRYDIQYRNVNVYSNKAEVEAFLDGSFELAGEGGDRYRRKSDYHRFVLEQDKDDKEKWRFLSGM